MVVYRLCNEKEYNEIINSKNFNNVGKKFVSDNKLNTYNYDNNKLYIHFFKNFESIFYLTTTKGYYICIYDIPNDILNENKSTGFYLDKIF